MKRTASHSALLAVSLMTAILVAGCDSSLEDGIDTDEQSPQVVVDNEPVDGAGSGNGTDPGEGNGTDPGEGSEPELTGSFTLTMETTTLDLTEGQGLAEVAVNLSRTDGHDADVTLSAPGEEAGDEVFLTRQFSDAVLSGDEDATTLLLDLAIGARPILPQTRTVLVTATDTAGQVDSVPLTLEIQPTDKPDIYLLVGQSNMIGVSQDNAKQAGAGEPDEPSERIRQLNVTGNDDENFSEAADFTSSRNVHNQDNPLTIAIDPLHSGLESDGGKSGTRIGLGLSFAKRALQDTTTEIYLVPAAWSDTGFCQRNSNRVEGIGWNATEKDVPELSGTLLHDRAIARTNIAIEQTGGVLRGILWHQGEADSSNRVCAELYAQNLAEMAQSLRTNIAEDARGAPARGPEADIPFIVGTMATGGEQVPFTDTKLLVDAAHRNVASTLVFADFVNTDDLIPPAFACGGGSCIHFGGEALREMGARYYERLISVLP